MSDTFTHLFTLLAPILAVVVRLPREGGYISAARETVVDSSTSSIGARLRAARRQRGFSVQEVAEVTKISVRALQAMEQDAFEQLPGGLFRRAYVKAYATAVGLDARALVAEYLSRFEADEVEAISGEQSSQIRRAAHVRRLALLLAAGVSVLAAWQFWLGQAQ